MNQSQKMEKLEELQNEKPKEERPEFVTDEHLEYLDALRESGATNMFGAGAYLQREFKELKKDGKANKVLSYWMHTFSKRHPPSR